MSAGVCRRCGADICWGRTTNGRPIPIDLEPRADGNLAVHRDHLHRLNVRVLANGEEPEPYERRGMPHFATCPQLGQDRSREVAPGVPSLGAARDRRRRAEFARRRGLDQ